MQTETVPKEIPEKKLKLVFATVKLMLRQGYSGTSLDDICAEAGVTKGSFFHYFKNKEEACLAGMDAWSGFWQQILNEANLAAIPDPLDRLDGLFDVMANAYLNPEVDPGCMVGTVAQECSLPSERFREICEGHLETWKVGTSKLLADAKASHPPKVDFDPDEVAWWLCSFVQGTLLIAKTRLDRAIVLSNIRHCRAYVHSLFGKENGK